MDPAAYSPDPDRQKELSQMSDRYLEEFRAITAARLRELDWELERRGRIAVPSGKGGPC